MYRKVSKEKNKMKSIDRYDYKTSKVKGRRYLQIWDKETNTQVTQVGNAYALLQKLVRLEKLESETNFLREKLTNLTEKKNEKKD